MNANTNSTTTTKYLIETKSGFVCRFNGTAVVVTKDIKLAKKFATPAQANAWGCRYQGAGYGLSSFTVELVTVVTGPDWEANYLNAF